jgi:hypothetical protein
MDMDNKLKSSTKDDIIADIKTFTTLATVLIDKNAIDDDWWEGVEFNGKQFDFNVFDWEDGDKFMRIVNVHPVTIGDDGYGVTDHSTWVRLLTEELPHDLDIDEDE